MLIPATSAPVILGAPKAVFLNKSPKEKCSLDSVEGSWILGIDFALYRAMDVRLRGNPEGSLLHKPNLLCRESNCLRWP